MMGQVSQPQGVTRRSLLAGIALLPMLGASACRHGKIGPVSWRNADEQIERLRAGLFAVARREPRLAGVQSLASIPANLADGLNSDDRTLLTKALYMDAREALQRTRTPVTQDQVRRVLERPFEVTQFDRGYAERRVAEARRRIETDADYGNAILIISNDPWAPHCVSLLTDADMPCWLVGLYFTVLVPRWIDMWGP